MSNLQKFVERLSELLSDREMKAANLAKELGVTRKVISRYLNGERLPSISMAFRLSEYFHCSIDFLLGRSDTGADFDPLPLPPFRERLPFLLDFFKKSRYRIAKDAHINESIRLSRMNDIFPSPKVYGECELLSRNYSSMYHDKVTQTGLIFPRCKYCNIFFSP